MSGRRAAAAPTDLKSAMKALRHLVLLATFGVSSAGAQMDAQRVLEALKARESRIDKLRVSAEWRGFRGRADDWYDTTAWKQPDYLPKCDIDYMIVRPWWQVALLDVDHFEKNPHLPKDPNIWWGRYAWVEGELVWFSRSLSAAPQYAIEIVDHTNPVGLRGEVYLTPLELELFDFKRKGLRGLREILARAVQVGQVQVRLEEPHVVLVEFPYPETEGQTIRARLDLARDAVPLMYEVHTRPPPGVKFQPLTWRMETRSVLAVGNSYIVGEAWIFNRNPNVLPDEVDVKTFRVRSVRRDESLTLDAIRIVPPERNVVIYDWVRGVIREVDAEGRVTRMETYDKPELEEMKRAWAVAATEGGRRVSEYRTRRTALMAILLGAAVLTVALGVVAWRYRRARLAG